MVDPPVGDARARRPGPHDPPARSTSPSRCGASCARAGCSRSGSNRDPTLDELAKESGFSVERVQELLDLVQDTVSLETPVGDGESLYGDLIEDTKTDAPDDQTAVRLRAKELSVALEQLNPRMRLVLTRRFGLDGQPPQTLEEVGTGLGITRERVRQLEARALRQLRAVAPELVYYLQT